jgi:hypothetical protein
LLPSSPESKKAMSTMAMSAHTMGLDQVDGPVGIAGGRPRPGGWGL